MDMEEFLNKKIGVKQVITSFGLQNFKYKGYKITVNEETKKVLKMEKTTEDIFVTANGQLHVDGGYLKNQYGHDMQLKGICIWAYDSQTFNEEFFRNIKEKYGVNCVRLALNSLNPDNEETDEQGRAFGYLYDIIDSIIANDMYAILDWHLINGSGFTNNPYDYEESAEKVFTTFAKYYKDVPNLMYELANEPSGTWEELIPYYNNLITKIREISPDCVILATSAGHGLDVDAILANPLEYENIMYAMHFYYTVHYLTEMQEISKAILNGLCIFASEWSPNNGSGGENQLTYANNLTNFMDNYNISSTYWMFTNGNTEYENLTDGAKFAVNYINHKYEDNSYSKYVYSTADYTMVARANVNENTGLYATDSLWHMSSYRDNIENIIFNDYINIPDNIIECRDISQTSQGTVIAYIIENNNGMYDLYIEGNEIYFPTYSSRMFAFMKNVKKFDNLSLVDTSNVEDFSLIFSYMVNLQEINLSNFNTSKATNMRGMFNSCSSLINLDVSSFDTSNVTIMTQMFVCSKLEKIDLSSFNTNSLNDIQSMFQSTSSLSEIDISSFDFKMIENYKDLFVFTESVSRTIYVKDEYAKNIVQTLNPAANIIIKDK